MCHSHPGEAETRQGARAQDDANLVSGRVLQQELLAPLTGTSQTVLLSTDTEPDAKGKARPGQDKSDPLEK